MDHIAKSVAAPMAPARKIHVERQVIFSWINIKKNMATPLPAREVVRLSKRLLARGVQTFARENPTVVPAVLGVVGCLSGFDVWRLFALVGWLLVGIASSIGFGVGIPTRVLFVWPHVLSVAAVESDPLAAWVAVLPVCVTHALGSALGELPPFLGASMLVQRFRLNQESTAMAVSHRWFVERMQSHGWFWVFVLAAWPNVAFDCAGLAAGASGMSLFGFLSAAVCGKAVVRAPVAAALVVASTHSVSWLPEWATSWASPSASEWSPLLGTCWMCFVVAASCVCMWWCMVEAAEEELRRRRA
ncbi:MAG: hypothetical protein CL450_09150 [Acidimicrobiaceae bacterium]|nr:hypothetical protein [Acidimicrobiaceae bacterium]